MGSRMKGRKKSIDNHGFSRDSTFVERKRSQVDRLQRIV